MQYLILNHCTTCVRFFFFLSLINALVISNHAPPPPPIPVGGQGIAVEMSMALTKVLPRQCGENTRGLLYIGKKGCDMKRCTFKWWGILIAGICGPKVWESPHYSPL